MFTRATIIGTTTDHIGRTYNIREVRPTVHGFDVLVGWPTGRRGKGMAGPQVIATEPLVRLLTGHAHVDAAPALPVSRGTLLRLRGELGINRRDAVATWWAGQDTSGTLTQVAAKLGRGRSTISGQERR